MPVILAATDFSTIGDHALDYAARLAADWGCRLEVVHAYFMPVTFNDPAMPVIPPDNLMEVSAGRMDKAVARLQAAFPQVAVASRVEYGDIQDVLEDTIEALRPVLVVTGSHGEDNADMWMGSTTLDLLRHATCPVLAVPPAAAFRPLKQLCLALDFSAPGEHLPAAALQQLLQTSGAALHLLHVAKEEGETAVFAFDLSAVPAALQSFTPAVHQTRTTGSVDLQIAEFCEANGMDWVAVIPHHHSFWQTLFHKSHTKEVVRLSHIPVLALHEEQA